MQVKNILMAVYFAADHVVWAGQAGIYTNKEALDRFCPRAGPAGVRRAPQFLGCPLLCRPWAASTALLVWQPRGLAGGVPSGRRAHRWQKLSLWSWFGGSGCTIISEAHELAKLAEQRKKGETDAEFKARRAKAMGEVDARLLTLVHALFQARPQPCHQRCRALLAARQPA